MIQSSVCNDTFAQFAQFAKETVTTQMCIGILKIMPNFGIYSKADRFRLSS